MSLESGNNGQLKLALAFALGLGVAGLGAWMFAGGKGAAGPQERAAQPSLAVSEPAIEREAPVPDEPIAAPPAPSAAEARALRAPARSPVKPAKVVARNTAPAPPPPPAKPAATVATQPDTPQQAAVVAPKPTQPQPPALPEVIRREQPKLDAVAPPPPAPASVIIKAGTVINVRLAERLSTETHRNGDTFSATLAQPLVVDGFVIAERNARIQGRIAQSERAGKVQGVSALSLQLTQLTTSDGQKIQIRTAPYLKEGETSKGDDAKKVAIGSALGAAIGAIAGGGKGAAIGAGAGAGAGAGTVALTRGKDVELDVETRLSFNLSEPVTLTEKLSH